MSHVASVDLEVTDLVALKKACAEMGLTYMEGQTTYKWYGRFMNDYQGADAAFLHGMNPKDYGKCAHAIRMKGYQEGDYELGVVKMPNGNYRLIYDFFGNGRKIADQLGKGCERMKQIYGITKAQMIAKLKGHMTQRKTMPNGSLKLVVIGV